jgi:hypothetical protein
MSRKGRTSPVSDIVANRPGGVPAQWPERENYTFDKIRKRVAGMLLLASSKARADVPELIWAELHPLPQRGDPRGLLIRLKMVDGYSRVIIKVRPHGTWKVIHPVRIDGCGNIFDESFDQVLADVIPRAASFRDP